MSQTATYSSYTINVDPNNNPNYNYNAAHLYRKYLNKGVPFQDLEESITDGLYEAYTRFNAGEKGKEGTFGFYAQGFVLKQITQRFKMHPSCFSDLVADDDEHESLEAQIEYTPEGDRQLSVRLMERFGEICDIVFPEAAQEKESYNESRQYSMGLGIEYLFPDRPRESDEFYRKPVDSYAEWIITRRIRDRLKFKEIEQEMGIRKGYGPHYYNRAYNEFVRRCAKPGVRDQICDLIEK